MQKAIELGRIVPEPSGQIEPIAADEAWLENTDERKARSPESSIRKHPEQNRTRARGGTGLHEDETGEVFTYAEERAKRERIDRQRKEIELRKLRGELVTVERVAAVNFRVGRQIRSRLEAIPDRLADILAGETDANAVDGLLRDEIRRVLELLGADPSAAGELDLEEEPEPKT